MHTLMLIAALVGAALILTWRLRETSRPVTARKIVLPPLGMSTGFAMFALAPARIPWSWGLSAFTLGALVLSYPLVQTSRLERDGEVIRMRRSKAFLWILLGLITLRIALRAYVEQYVSPLQTASIFFVLAFGMITRWRLSMYREYQRLTSPHRS